MSKSNETTPNVPTLRFDKLKDFHRQKLGTLCTIVGGYAFDSKKMIPKGNYQIVKMGNFYAGKLDLSRTPTFLDNPTQSELSALLKKHDIVITLTGTVNKKDYGYTVQINNENNLLLNQRCALIRAKNNIDSNYLLYLLKANEFLSQFYASSVGGTGNQTNVSIKAIEQFIVSIPHLDEQKRIGKFLSDIDKRILVQNKIISKYETLIKGIRERVVSGSWQWKKLDELIQEGVVRLNRGNIIPKHQKDNTYKYPVYSSSTQNNGLMGYNNTYMFDKELITLSIDGGGNFFYRKKHKFNVTNVCGIMQVDENVYSYRFIAEMLTYQHSKMKFDYQSKAHPSVISSLYSLPCLPILEQNSYCQLFVALDRKMQIEQYGLNKLKEQKKYLLSKMFI